MKINVVSNRNEIARCLAIRHEVFVGEQGVTESEEQDGLDKECVHILATDGAVAVGAARVNYASADYAKIQRVAVIKPARGKGVGAEIILHIIAFLRAEGLRGTVRLGSQSYAIEFYRKLGFEPFGDEYLDARIPHRDMELKL